MMIVQKLNSFVFIANGEGCSAVCIFTSGVCHFCKYINKHIVKDRFIFNPFTLSPESGLETYPGKVVKWICIRFIFNPFILPPESGLGTYPGKVDMRWLES